MDLAEHLKPRPMANELLKAVLKTAKTAAGIAIETNRTVLLHSMGTGKKLVKLYTETGKGALKVGTFLAKDTARLLLENQKKVMATGRHGVEETIKTIRSFDVPKAKPPKKAAKPQKTKEISIDDLMKGV